MLCTHRSRKRPPPAPRIRCGIATPALARGGAERWVLDLIRFTDPRRVEWAGIAMAPPAAITPETLVEARALAPVLQGPAAVAELVRQVDVLLYWGVPQFWELVPDDAPCHTVGVSHGSGEWTAHVFGAGYPEAWAVAAVSQVALTPLRPELRERATVIYNGVDPGRLIPRRPRELVREAWGVPQDALLAGFMGRLAREKNPLAFVRALALLPDWHGVLVGQAEPEWAEAVATEISTFGLTERMHVVGFDPDVGSVLGALDVLLMPAHEEGYGLALVEALLARVPVISTPVGIVSDVRGLVRSVPLDPSPERLAAAVRAESTRSPVVLGRMARAEAWAREDATAAQFGARWTDYLTAG